jgi:hypothetical protein
MLEVKTAVYVSMFAIMVPCQVGEAIWFPVRLEKPN